MLVHEISPAFHLPVSQRGAEHEVHVAFFPGLLNLCLACWSTHVEVLYIRVRRKFRRQHEKQWLLRVNDLQGFVSTVLSVEILHVSIARWNGQV